MEQTLIRPLHALMETLEGAVIVAQLFRFGNFVVDAVVVAASIEAAHLYGYQEPVELEGKFTSRQHHPDDHWNCKLLSIARRFGLQVSIPPEYDIRAILPDGSIRYIHKHVQQIVYEDSSYWVSTSHEVSADAAVLLPNLEEQIPSDYIQEWSGDMSASQFVQHLEQTNNIPVPDLTLNALHTIMSTLQTSSPTENMMTATTERQSAEVQIDLGTTRRLPDGRYIHRCGHCARLWVGSDSNPSKCARSRPDVWGPACGNRKWREVTETGQALAIRQSLGLTDQS